MVTLDGENVILAHVSIRSPYRVGKYGIDVAGLERLGIPAIRRAISQCELVVIDEIGKMELFSAGFRDAVSEAIGSGQRVLGTIMLRSHPWADAIKQQPQVNLITVTRDNYRQVLAHLGHWLNAPKFVKM